MAYPKHPDEAIVDALFLVANIYAAQEDREVLLGAIMGIGHVAQLYDMSSESSAVIEAAFEEELCKLGCARMRVFAPKKNPFPEAIVNALRIVGYVHADYVVKESLRGAVMGIARVVQFSVISANHDAIRAAFEEKFAELLGFGQSLAGSQGVLIHLEDEKRRLIPPIEKREKRQHAIINVSEFRRS